MSESEKKENAEREKLRSRHEREGKGKRGEEEEIIGKVKMRGERVPCLRFCFWGKHRVCVDCVCVCVFLDYQARPIFD